jgi:hypothetical protein
MEEQKPLKDRISEMEKTIEELSTKSSNKKFKLPFRAKLSKVAIKKNFITILLIHENGNLQFLKTPIVNGTIDIEGVPRIATADYTTFYKGKPFMILPAWSLKPFSPADNYEDTVQKDLTTAGRRLILERMKLDAIKPKKMGFGIIGWVILGIAVVGVGYYLIRGGKIF